MIHTGKNGYIEKKYHTLNKTITFGVEQVKKFLFEIIALVILAVGVYLVFFYDSEDVSKGEKLMEETYEPDDGGENIGEVTFSLEDVSGSGDDEKKADYNYTVKNTDDKKIKLTFGSSMKYDFYITDESDAEVYRESDEKSYMQVIQEITLEPGEEETFAVKLPELDPGEYTLTIMLAAKGYSDGKLRADFVVE